MSIHLEKAVNSLKTDLLRLATLVEEQLDRALLALQEQNLPLAQQVIAEDNLIDQREVDLEEDCLRILALYQPVAFDLRFVIAVLKINNDLERIGDLAAGIATQVAQLIETPTKSIGLNFREMAARVKQMLFNSLEALINNDTKLAIKVCESDLEVDTIHGQNMKAFVELLFSHPTDAPSILNYLVISRNLERIADQTTNIAEDVVYLVDGKIVRHTGL